ncbi:hypothetical protein MMC29_007887, partial [Sticta canariensis]|nr:hypothetical protein [Sticta canariensis]
SKVAIVTGASREIGAEIALELASRGAKSSHITPLKVMNGAEELVSKIKALDNGSSAIKVRADLGQIESPEQIVEAARSAFGEHIDILINNAAIGQHKTITESMAVVLHLRAPGRIINIGSLAASIGMAGFSIYSATKGALVALTRSLAAELGPAGHSVNCVNPGVVMTDAVDTLPPGYIEANKALTPMENRSGQVERYRADRRLLGGGGESLDHRTIDVGHGGFLHELN